MTQTVKEISELTLPSPVWLGNQAGVKAALIALLLWILSADLTTHRICINSNLPPKYEFEILMAKDTFL